MNPTLPFVYTENMDHAATSNHEHNYFRNSETVNKSCIPWSVYFIYYIIYKYHPYGIFIPPRIPRGHLLKPASQAGKPKIALFFLLRVYSTIITIITMPVTPAHPS
ncbi:hypothetical protein F4819DRAFT_269324 [Hypoxylon fuscum]|nr:hypothetical protein F4819DRAFT_269324 [Hypoxylon fuscum]